MQSARNVSGTLLRRGYTTGSCAAGAAKAAALVLLGGGPAERLDLTTPGGERLTLEIHDLQQGDGWASCAVRKEAGDDPDITNGILIYARVELTKHGISIDGGQGVGRVTKPGLDQPMGAAAINSAPRAMITAALQEAARAYGYQGGFAVTVSIPEGEALARRTFNPRLGIEGGLSVIGTTGIVEPMSSKALADTILLELRQLAAAGRRAVLLTPGNYGEAFAREELKLAMTAHVNCSNFIGDAIDGAVEQGFADILLVGHIGKLVKLGIGVTNTHSAFGDGRMETLLACALEAGAELPLLRGISVCVTADAALMLLHRAGLLSGTMEILGRRIGDCLKRRVPPDRTIGYVCFTNAPPMHGVLTQSETAGQLMKNWRETT